MMRPSRAFTLIELLIVVAFLGLLAGASLGPIIAPLRERSYAEAEAAGLGALERLVPALVADAHAAGTLEGQPGARAFALPRRSGALVATYALGADGVLRRGVLRPDEAARVLAGEALPISAVPLVEGVTELAAERTGDGRLRVTVAATRQTHARALPFDHEVVVRIGNPSREATP